ncbi:hypothetical protein WOLCODRAFT_152081 [Wolfiporia cocos MD-104 SS10]|uniref:Uncharacterized protein n=1 Tax=Wolfiporia cocos (strain MD-104) TaxID=742152 RepID=A0A2H3JZ72_WOLCO|nr:hypothetical protein WOLCODRAFT_152081 [Wolfiporia cocos MD-104 SS10]
MGRDSGKTARVASSMLPPPISSHEFYQGSSYGTSPPTSSSCLTTSLPADTFPSTLIDRSVPPSPSDPSVPPRGENEEQLCTWFNGMGQAIYNHLSESPGGFPAPKRKWSWGNYFSDIEGRARLQPDLILQYATSPTPAKEWGSVQMVCQVTGTVGFPPELDDHLLCCAFKIFDSQPFRRFIPTLAISNDQFKVVVSTTQGP